MINFGARTKESRMVLDVGFHDGSSPVCIESKGYLAASAQFCRNLRAGASSATGTPEAKISIFVQTMKRDGNSDAHYLLYLESEL